MRLCESTCVREQTKLRLNGIEKNTGILKQSLIRLFAVATLHETISSVSELFSKTVNVL